LEEREEKVERGRESNGGLKEKWRGCEDIGGGLEGGSC
jgi:hypothetical protein